MTRALLIGLTGAVLAAGCGGGGGNPTSPSSTGSALPTVTLAASGVTPNIIRIDTNQQVRFVNSMGRSAEIHSDPHPTHGSCPPLDEVGIIATGQSKSSGAFTRVGTCTYHEHNDPDNKALRGTILVNVNEPGPGPGYTTTH